jgi:aminomethyltransferase
MVTNSVQELRDGAGSYSFVLNAQGRIQGDCYIFADDGSLLLETGAAQKDVLLPLLDRFIIMDEVELLDAGEGWTGTLVAGPEAEALLAKIGVVLPEGEAPRLRHTEWEGSPCTAIRAFPPLVPRFEIWTDRESSDRLRRALTDTGAPMCGDEALEALRVLEGVPLFGRDIRDRDLPQETGQTRALHFSKGCYLGQEIVERIRSRGNVHRAFTGFLLEGAKAEPGASLSRDGKAAGELTSVITLPAQGAGTPRQIALGYARREALAGGGALEYDGGIAAPASLPFRLTTRL